MPRRTFAKDRIYAGAMLNASRVLKRNLYPTSTFEILEQSQIKAVLLQRERERERERYNGYGRRVSVATCTALHQIKPTVGRRGGFK